MARAGQLGPAFPAFDQPLLLLPLGERGECLFMPLSRDFASEENADDLDGSKRPDGGGDADPRLR